MSFVISGLAPEPFRPLFDLSDAELAERRIVRRTVEAPIGSPCRVTLQDAQPGETVLLMNYEHQPADTPFRASHAIFVREGDHAAWRGVDEIPPAMAARSHSSLRAFDADGMMVAAELVATADLKPAIGRLLGTPSVAYLHAHYAGAGCYAARIERA